MPSAPPAPHGPRVVALRAPLGFQLRLALNSQERRAAGTLTQIALNWGILGFDKS